jgi:hypothetical protein
MRCSRKTHAIDVTHVVLAAGRSREDFPSPSALASQGLAVVFSGACMPGAGQDPSTTKVVLNLLTRRNTKTRTNVIFVVERQKLIHPDWSLAWSSGDAANISDHSIMDALAVMTISGHR